jgi:hypothetical protein
LSWAALNSALVVEPVLLVLELPLLHAATPKVSVALSATAVTNLLLTVDSLSF